MPDVLQDKRVKARKEHTCFWCGKKIAKGEEYRYVVQIADDFGTFHECDRCKPYVAEMFKEWGHMLYLNEGFTDEDFRLFMHDHYPDVLEEWRVNDADN